MKFLPSSPRHGHPRRPDVARIEAQIRQAIIAAGGSVKAAVGGKIRRAIQAASTAARKAVLAGVPRDQAVAAAIKVALSSLRSPALAKAGVEGCGCGGACC